MPRILSETGSLPAPLTIEAGYSTVIPPFPWVSTACEDLVFAIDPDTGRPVEVRNPYSIDDNLYHGIFLSWIADGSAVLRPREYEVHWCPCHEEHPVIAAALQGRITGTGR